MLTASAPRVGLTFPIVRLAIALKRYGHNVIVISDSKEQDKGLSHELMDEGITLYVVRGIDGVNFDGTLKIREILRTADFDIIHVGGLTKFAKFYLAKWLSRKGKVPVIVHIDSISDHTTVLRILYISSSRMLNSSANMVIPVSHWTEMLLKKYGVRKDRIFVMHNAIYLKWFDSMPGNKPPNLDFIDEIRDKNIIAQVSVLSSGKGHRYLLTAMRRILDVHSNVHLVIVGGGPSRRELEKMAETLRISKNVTFAGQIPNYYIPQLLSNVDIGVLASLREQFPRALLEYMAAQKPIVATNVGGIPEAIVNGINGYLVPPADSRALAHALNRLITHPEEAKKMGVAGRRIVEERFSMKSYIPKLESMYKTVLGI